MALREGQTGSELAEFPYTVNELLHPTSQTYINSSLVGILPRSNFPLDGRQINSLLHEMTPVCLLGDKYFTI